MFNAEKYTSVIPLINALEERPVDGETLGNEAVNGHLLMEQSMASKILLRNYMTILQLDPNVMPMEGWQLGNMMNRIRYSHFLLDQADQGDLEKAQEEDAYNDCPKFRQAIGEALKAAPPIGTRHDRFYGRTTSIINLLSNKGLK